MTDAIRTEYDKPSGLTSIELLARTVGTDPKKLYRITNGNGLPVRHADLDLARQQLTDRYGPAGIEDP